ncbi:phosphoribosylformylglycinamidine synthase subunit PurS [Pediococcus stilesii]|uniref:Phosphoribosylformylglycinamidine synthase subunit PurS n=1 Tax=Pediococcus stilesii TaxID=331679 RepID=A0A5R9BTS0_9LACO|nr:phosphoribosylformylglycinamidine synthase subunit PurS [Pediococcus stilesii]TLQ04054.1 phosphoribosylformylglycinamidine synthase subunit PurS [Pediococcus stilesii]
MYNVKVYVTYKKSILDPQGEAIKTALHRMEHQDVMQVTVGKYFEMQIKDNGQNIDAQVNKMCDELLANVNMETYRYEITEAAKVEE